LETVAVLPTAHTIQELNALFRPALEALGFSLFAGIKLANPDGHIHVRALFGDGFEPWLNHYVKMGYAGEDLIVRECFRTSEPFCWTDIVQRDYSPRTARIVEAAHTFGLRQGLVVPVRKPDASIFVVLFAGESFDSSDLYARAASHLLARYYGAAGSHFYALERASREDETLTHRQIECLRWVRAGKTSIEIAEIVGITPPVVNEHITNACRRLGVRTRTQAVLAASSAGYFDL